jgi:hypothetical protein
MDIVDSIADGIRKAQDPLHGLAHFAAAILGWLIIAAILGVMAVADYTVVSALLQSR